MNLQRAEHLGMCFGVRRAIALALEEAQHGPITILGDLVHNHLVDQQLRQRGVQIENRIERVTTPAVLISAHGASQHALQRALCHGLEVKQATCPLVQLVHRTVAELVESGYHPVIVGKRDHVEVRGVTEDLAEYDVVLSEDEVAAMVERPRFGVVAQTTQPIDHVRKVVGALRTRFPKAEVRFIDTVCQPTKQRQAAAIELAQQTDVMIIVGDARSNNSRLLADTCRRYCPRVYQVQSAEDLRPEWYAEARSVGLTAGTSTPDWVIDEVEQTIKRWAGLPSERPAAANLVPENRR